MLDVKLSEEHRNHIWLEWDHAIEHATHNETKGVLKAAKQFEFKMSAIAHQNLSLVIPEYL